jgi:MoxR-like ATPase
MKSVGSEASLQLAVDRLNAVRNEIAKVIVGQDDVVEGVLICLLSGGHVLLEGVPGLGKTTLLRTLARTLQLKYSRIQFTPDLMPADIVGSMVMENDDRGNKVLRFQFGPIFANVVLADEINRATPKTQSALLEAMQERTVTSGNTTHELEAPFLVMATQNPIEMEGTYPLPEAQRDRFMARIQMGYPTPNSELDMLESHGSSDPLAALQPVTDGSTVRGLIEAVKKVYVSPAVRHYIVQIVNATRNSRDLRLGASPRATLQLLRASRAFAAMSGRDYVTPDDVAALGVSVLAHRVLPSTDAQLAHRTVTDVIAQAIQSVHIPDRR